MSRGTIEITRKTGRHKVAPTISDVARLAN